MLPKSRQARTTLYAGLGVAVLATTTLILTTSLATGATDAVVDASEAISLSSSASGSTAEAELADVQAPAAPAGCSQTQLAERATQIGLLDNEKQAEARVLATITDGSLADKLGAIRDRADIILGRIASLDARCADASAPAQPAPPVVVVPGDDAEAPQAPEQPAAPEPADPADPAARELTNLAISCDEPDLSGVDPAAAARAETELAANEAQLEARLLADFPRFAARVAREANPEAAANEFATLAENLANTLQDRRAAILQRAGLADTSVAESCEVVPADA
ncbi:hypothetical protein [Pseudonocardia lacus]|uniref:hypothetical protein n=1 Tax=Pseudonocardia lacus TaxID=2835865 RepID=UPI001BDCBC60|nr:hypothetical protein [Pseudonocardia lacus]